MIKGWCKGILAIILIFCLTACGRGTPPLELAPDGDIVQKAIALQISKTESILSQKLNATPPQVEVSNVKVKQIEPLYINKLAAYHLQGTYNLKLSLPRKKVIQKNNPFDIYIQRQAEGKTWRLLRKENDLWRSYLIA